MAWEKLEFRASAMASTGAPRVTVAYRQQSKSGGKHLTANINRQLAAALGWKERERVELAVDRATGRIRAERAQAGRALHGSSAKGLAFTAPLPWLADMPSRLAEQVTHEIEAPGVLIITLPDWARPASPATGARPLAPVAAPPPAPVAAAPAPAPAPGGRGMLTSEQEALFRRLWPDRTRSASDVLRAINGLPGQRFAASTSLYSLAQRLGLPTQRTETDEGQPAPPPAPAQAAPASAAKAPTLSPSSGAVITVAGQEARIREEVRECRAAGMGARAIKEELGIGLDDVHRHLAAIAAQEKGVAA
ncbi:hypothetical protein [Paracraurococcus ruber]|uniref:Uncharacterized protein n=1 Tax=Paracraurococcus ruber TaxID=77675 RepID=A0ABS1CRF8_9PROT|nr:hypothetical protein [Paracraurococcus ruber]MBK1656872.1 hypothetical protein [Paracraurococcus ruber]TDG33986.1 hypothetical protein E2C05_01725 [Paracraurococcus ruber]